MVTGTAEETTQAERLEEEKDGGAEKIFTQTELDAKLGTAGQKLQKRLETATTERDDFKTQVGTLTTEMTAAKGSIESLTKDVETMSEDDADKGKLLRLIRQKETDLSTLAKEKADLAPKLAEVTQWNRDQLVYTVADEYVTSGGEKIDFDSFKASADKFKLSDRDGLEDLAETLGLKLKGDNPAPSVKPFKGGTDGGAMNTDEKNLKVMYPTMF